MWIVKPRGWPEYRKLLMSRHYVACENKQQKLNRHNPTLLLGVNVSNKTVNYLLNYSPNSMEQRISWHADNNSAGQEFPAF